MGRNATRHAKRIAALEVEVGETKLVIEQQDRDLERMRASNRDLQSETEAFADRIAALEAGLLEACDLLERSFNPDRAEELRRKYLADGKVTI